MKFEIVKQGLYHREDGPAIINDDLGESWWINGKLHRIDGPAVVWDDGDKEWYLNDIEYTEEEYTIKLKRLINL